MNAILFLALLLMTLPVLALEREISNSVWMAGLGRKINDSSANPDNRVLELPDRGLIFELRPDARFNFKSSSMVLRPRLIQNVTSAEVKGERSSDTFSQVQWSDAFVTGQINDELFFTYGLQNYQWGPAELASPSNRIFRDPLQIKDVLYVVKGKHLLRFNYTPAEGWTEVLMAELSDNGDPEYEAKTSYTNKALLKSEYTWSGGADYAGLVLGWRENGGSWVGEYINLDLVEGLSFYADASHQKGSQAWYPVYDPSRAVVLMERSLKDQERIYTYLISGLRYAFENGNDLRLEWLYQEAGYSNQDTNLAWTALTSTNPIQRSLYIYNATRLHGIGLDYPGREYGLISYRIPDFLQVRNWTLYLREMLSLQDGSSIFYVSSENALGENGTVFGTLTSFAGADGSELKGFYDYGALLGYRHTW